jgi:cellulose synthase/poly-beta-1,6-N-acetylglucosamine synthase-like glycosyltransferase
MSNPPAFSVIVPLFNKETTVKRALTSVLNQTFQNFEIVVVDDGSTDRGADIVRNLADPRIRLFHKDNQGVSVARNRGIREARADMVAFLDADDEWLPGYLGGIHKLINSFSECDVFATGYEYVCPVGTSRLPEFTGLAIAVGSSGIMENYLEVAASSDPPLWTSAVVVRKRALEKVRGFPEGIVAGEDLLTWSRLAVHGKIAYLNIPLARFHFPTDFSDRPERYAKSASCGNAVIQGLLELAGASGPAMRPQIAAYIGRVAEMAAVSAISNGHYVAARDYAKLAWKHGKKNAKVITVSVCSLFSVAGVGRRIWTWLFRRYASRRAGRAENRRD